MGISGFPVPIEGLVRADIEIAGCTAGGSHRAVFYRTRMGRDAHATSGVP